MRTANGYDDASLTHPFTPRVSRYLLSPAGLPMAPDKTDDRIEEDRMSELGTDRELLAGELADCHRGCECGQCLGEAERFIVKHIDPMTEKDLADAWEEGWQSGAGDRAHDLTHPTASAHSPNPHRVDVVQG